MDGEQGAYLFGAQYHLLTEPQRAHTHVDARTHTHTRAHKHIHAHTHAHTHVKRFPPVKSHRGSFHYLLILTLSVTYTVRTDTVHCIHSEPYSATHRHRLVEVVYSETHTHNHCT